MDSNILLRILDRGSVHHPAAMKATGTLSAAGHTLCIGTQSLIELWAVATRPIAANGLGLPPPDVRAHIDKLRPGFMLLEEPFDIADRWLELATRYAVSGKQAHDTRLATLMIAHGVTHLLTFNGTDFARYAEVTALDPDDPVLPSP